MEEKGSYPLLVQWVRSHPQMQGVQIRFLAGELRSHILISKTPQTPKNIKQKQHPSALLRQPSLSPWAALCRNLTPPGGLRCLPHRVAPAAGGGTTSRKHQLDGLTAEGGGKREDRVSRCMSGGTLVALGVSVWDQHFPRTESRPEAASYLKPWQ